MKIFITGITGSLGNAIVPKLLDRGYEVVGLSRDEYKIANYKYKVKIILGDIRDVDSIVKGSRGCGVIYHLAALKHVDFMEENIAQCILTNLISTGNVIKAQKENSVSRIVFTSTDKAVYPINAYGNCKALSEKIILKSSFNNVVCRYGNVFNSRGSVIQKFIHQLQFSKEVTITNDKMSRFFITLNDAANFVIEASLDIKAGLCIPTMKAVNIVRLVDLIAKVLNVNGYRIKFIGLRPGEKINESLVTEFDKHENEKYKFRHITSENAAQFNDDELLEIIRAEI